jgi:hypothetical protein
MLSALQLDDYIVDEFHLEASQLYLTDPEKAQTLTEEPADDEIGFGIRLFTESDADDVLGLRLVIDINRDIEDWADDHRYRSRASVVGQFEFQDDPESRPPAEDLSRFFLKSSISILYGILRTRLADATSGQPYSKLLLPAMDFTPFIEDMELTEAQKKRFEELTASGEPSSSAE